MVIDRQEIFDLFALEPHGQGKGQRVGIGIIGVPLDGLVAFALGAALGADGPAYRKMFTPMTAHWQELLEEFLGPLPIPPKHPFISSRFLLKFIQPARRLAEATFSGEPARAMFAGMAAHSILPLEHIITSAYGLMMVALGHANGWPLVRGGSQRLAEALAGYLRSLGGEIITDHLVGSMKDIPPARDVLFDLTPRQLLRIVGEQLPAGYRRQLERYRYGPGVFKVDYALSAPIPWENKRLLDTATVHLGGTMEEIAEGERTVWQGRVPDLPYVLLAQQSLVDPSRAPEGQHTAWAYTHVPSNFCEDMTPRIEAQIERFAPGFKNVVLARSVKTAQDMERYNPNYIGGDINGGVQDLGQFFTRPVARWNPYSTPNPQIWICSSSTTLRLAIISATRRSCPKGDGDWPAAADAIVPTMASRVEFINR